MSESREAANRDGAPLAKPQAERVLDNLETLGEAVAVIGHERLVTGVASQLQF